MLERSAPELVARELDRELNGGIGSNSAPNKVHDLTSVVRKKRKAPETTEAGQNETSPVEKKTKLETQTETQ